VGRWSELAIGALVAVVGCSSSLGGRDGGATSNGGAAGQGGAAGSGGARDAGPDGAGCVGTAGFGCIYGDCGSDVGTTAICLNGSWSCPTGAIPSTSCGGCTGNPPPGYVCGDGGWIQVDAGGTPCAGPPTYECVGQCGSDLGQAQICMNGMWTCRIGTFDATKYCDPCYKTSPPSCGMGGAGGRAGAGGAGGQAGTGGVGGAWDGGPDGEDAGCSGSPGLTCIVGSCNNDVGTPALCANGVWSCPSGSVDYKSCGGCVGNPPPNYVCGDGGWMRIDGAGGASGI
jgi:hypothetical protein